MFSQLFTQLFKFVGIFFRTIKAFALRQLRGITTYFQRLKNFSHNAAMMATSTMQSAANVSQKPTKRGDYIEVGNLLISKMFLVRLVIGIVIVGMLIWFFVWPFLLSRFFTARFKEDDARIRDWSGKVIVYSDPKKTVPVYEGRLEKGVLQGSGKRYDENGVLVYDGNFQDGVYSGTGNKYEDGLLVYSGQFLNGVSEGNGALYREGSLVYQGSFHSDLPSGNGTSFVNDKKRYQGQFDEGVPNGNGKAYGPNDVLTYEGGFVDGVFSGKGKKYTFAGKLSYEGDFANGKPSGTGKEYGADGALIYEGEFSDGVYNGKGIYTLSPGNLLEATFTKGVPDGTVRWSKNGSLYYEGEWKNGKPSGFGKLYNHAGDVLYQGQLLDGTLDGAWLLSLTVDAFRQALGETQTTSYRENDRSFLISSPELGVIGRCNYRTDSAESEVYSVYIFPVANSDWFHLLPGEDNVNAPEWPENIRIKRGALRFNPPEGVTAAKGDYYSIMAFEPDRDLRTTLLYQDKAQQTASVLTWSRLSLLPEKESESEEPSESEKMGDFLKSLDSMEPLVGADLPTNHPYYGEEDISSALAACQTPEQAGELTEALVEYWRLSETQKGLEDNLSRVETMLTDERSALSMGNGSETLAASLADEKLALEGRILSAQSGRKQAELAAGKFGAEPSKLAVDKMLLFFDPGSLDLDQLSVAAAAWARYKDSNADSATLELEIKSLLVDLANSYSTVSNARSRYEGAVQAVQSAENSYAIGKADKATWQRAANTQTDAQLALYDALASFTKYANTLNQKTGGLISRINNWYPKEFGFPEELPEKPAETSEKPEEAAPEEAAKLSDQNTKEGVA